MTKAGRYEAWCLRCLGGGKSLGAYSAKREADRAAMGHMDAYGCSVIKPVFSGDPRGAVLKLAMPSGRTNDFAKEGVCVP